MIAGLRAGSEFTRFKRFKFTRIAIVAIVLMPLLYSALYLWAFWNPFGNVNSLPVALVNSDKGATVDGTKYQVGDDVAQGLMDSDEINWSEVSAQEAEKGVKDGKFYFSLEIPQDFSSAIASPKTDNPHKAQLVATYNDTNGYLSTKIGENVMREVVSVLGEKAGTQGIEQVLLGVTDAGTGLRSAAYGAGQLDDGLKELTVGLQKSKDGTGQLRDGTGQLVTGVDQLNSGSQQLAQGTQQLSSQVNGATASLDAVVDQLEGSADALNVSGSLAADVNSAAQNATSLMEVGTQAQDAQAAELNFIASQLRAAGLDSAANRVDGVAQQIQSTGVGSQSPLYETVQSLSSSAATLDNQLNGSDSVISRINSGELSNNVSALRTGVTQLNDGMQQLNSGLGQLDSSVGQLNQGVIALDDGNAQLLQGAGQLESGANELATKLAEGADQAPQWTEQQRLDMANVMGGPVDLGQNYDAGNNNFGTGLAPFFFSLALFVAGIILFIIMPPLQNRAVASGLMGIRAAFDGFLPAGIIVTFQAMTIVAVTVLLVGLRPHNVWGVVGVAILVGWVFIMISQSFNALFGPGAGKVITMAVLMLQVVSCGGLYPVETQNGFLQFIHKFNPMTYSVNAFRQVMHGVYDERLPQAILALVFFGILAMSLSSLAVRLQRTWNLMRLYPPLPM